MTKVCSICKKEKDTSEFHKHKGHSDGLHTMCKECRGCKKKVITEGRKICSKCNRNLPIEEFNNQRMGYLGKRSYCRRCQNDEADEARFSGMRKVVLERDNYKCTLCGSDYILQVHHKDVSGRNKPKELTNNSIENLTTLCVVCHAKLHSSKDAFKRG